MFVGQGVGALVLAGAIALVEAIARAVTQIDSIDELSGIHTAKPINSL
jgi:hypothetical protein